MDFVQSESCPGCAASAHEAEPPGLRQDILDELADHLAFGAKTGSVAGTD